MPVAAFRNVECSLRTIHGWLGVFVLPWIVILGLTGLYLNHARTVSSWLSGPAYDEAQFDSAPGVRPTSLAQAQALAATVWPGASFELSGDDSYHKRKVWMLKSAQGRVIVVRETGHYWVKTRFRRATYAPDGTLLHKKFYWGTLFKSLHKYGWFDRTFQRWLTDIAGGAMVIFGLSGLYLFLTPRLRRRRNLRARGAAQPDNTAGRGD